MTNQGQKTETNEEERKEHALQEPPDAPAEFSRLLEGRRWDVKKEPFRGFQSPPGRF